MRVDPFVVPVYRALTLVGAVLSRDPFGDFEHVLVMDTTLPDPADVIYHLRTTAVASSGRTVAHSTGADGIPSK